jgi:hypothetical protein
MKSTSKKIRMVNDKYYTPHSVTFALLDVEDFGPVLDPCAGAGHIVDACRQRGIEARGSDIEPSGEDIDRLDWLGSNRAVADSDIITNPPYGKPDIGRRLMNGWLAVRFIEEALEDAGWFSRKVAMLLHADFDSGRTRAHLFTHRAFARKYVLTDRINWANLPATERSSTNHAWFVWDLAKRDLSAPTLHYLSAPTGMRGFR